MPPKLCGAKPDAIQGSRCGRIHPRFGEFAERICSKQLPLNLLYHILPQKAPHHRKFPHRPTFTPPPPSAHCPQKSAHNPQMQKKTPSKTSPTTTLNHSPSFFDPFPDETTRFRSLPLQKVHPAFHPAPSPIPRQPDSKASLPPKQPLHTHPCNPFPSPNNTVFPVPLAALQK